eukprot:15658365-Heterocapsa_arctica.AAC.1
MLTDMQSQQEQLSTAAEGFGIFDNNYGADTTDDTRKTYQASNHNAAGLIEQSRRVLFKPLCGLFNQEKLLPVKHCSIQIELELVSNMEDAIVTADDATNSKRWSISDAQIKCDLLTLDSSLENEYT